MDYYLAITNHEIVLFAATWMDLEIHIKWSQSEKDKYHVIITYMWKLKKDTNESIYKTDLQTSKTNLWLPKGKVGGRDKLRVWD